MEYNLPPRTFEIFQEKPFFFFQTLYRKGFWQKTIFFIIGYFNTMGLKNYAKHNKSFFSITSTSSKLAFLDELHRKK